MEGISVLSLLVWWGWSRRSRIRSDVPADTPAHSRRWCRGISGVSWRIEVDGDSMAPALLAGDRLVVLPRRRVAPGQVVVFPDPRHSARILVKRVVRISPETIEVRGDNPWASTDSRDFGPVPTSTIWGRAVYRYFPPDRVGWLGPKA